MSLDKPEWLNEHLIRTCLQNGDENKLVLVKSIGISTVVPPGNNFGGCLLRVKVEYPEEVPERVQCLSLVVKGPPTSVAMKEAFGQFSHVEPTFYKLFLPEAYKISPNINFAPKTYLSAIGNVVILEDLKNTGYSMADRCKLLDFEHCRLYTIAAATFHAVSVAVHKKYKDLVESLGTEKMFSNYLQSALSTKRFSLVALCYLADKMECTDNYKRYSDIVRNSSTTIWDSTVEAVKRRTTLNTLHQGDAWTTNMMFKYDSSGNVTDVKLLDFQGLRYSSPVNDLVYFIWTSANHDVRENRLQDLYLAYCLTVNEKLEEFCCSERLSIEELMENVRILSPFILVLSASIHPIVTSEKLLDVDGLMSTDNSKIIKVFEGYYDKHYCEYHLPKVLKELETVGVFEYLNTLNI